MVFAQPWYEGTGVPTLTPIGFIRIEDPDGEVGMESHLVSDGQTLYHLPMTYRGRPLAADTVAAAMPHASSAGRREMPASFLPIPASL